MRAAVRLAVGLVCGAAVALGVAAPAMAADEGPVLSVSADALDAALDCVDGDADLDPVLLIPGTGLTPGPNFDWNYGSLFAAQNRAYCTVELPLRATGDIQVAAEYVVHALRTMGEGTDVVGYSQGGMIGRWALKYWPDTRDLVDDLVGLAPSNHGTLDADVLCAAGPCAPAIHQQALTADFIDALNTGQETWAGIDYTVAYTLLDEVVVPNAVPPASSPLRKGGGGGGEGDVANLAVQDVCPGHVADHITIGTFDAVAAAIALDALDADGPADADRIDRAVCLAPYMPGVDPLTFPADLARFSAAVGTGIATAPQVPAEPDLADYAG